MRDTSHRLLMIYGLSDWQDGSVVNGNEETVWNRLWEEKKGFSIRWDASQIPKWRCQGAVRLRTVEFRGEE